MRLGLNNRFRTFGASLCLLAAGLLYAPAIASAWSARAAACCASDHCNIAAHRHAPKVPAPMDGMNCGHEFAALTLNSCSMSCCTDQERHMIEGVVFVLPSTVGVPEPLLLAQTVLASPSLEIAFLAPPLSPPPRISLAV